MLAAIHVIVDRDGYDILAVVAGIVLFATGTVTFVYWAVGMRRRPEAKIEWAYRELGTADWTPWPAEIPRAVPAGSDVSIRVTATNVGDAPGEQAITNFVVPERCQAIREHEGVRTSAMDGVGHPVAGSGLTRASRLLKDERYWTLGLTWIQFFVVTVPTLSEGAAVEVNTLMFEISQARLNARGKRWFPVLHVLGPLESRDEPKRPRLAFRKVEAQENVWCRVASRYDFRDIRSYPPDALPD